MDRRHPLKQSPRKTVCESTNDSNQNDASNRDGKCHKDNADGHRWNSLGGPWFRSRLRRLRWKSILKSFSELLLSFVLCVSSLSLLVAIKIRHGTLPSSGSPSDSSAQSVLNCLHCQRLLDWNHSSAAVIARSCTGHSSFMRSRRLWAGSATASASDHCGVSSGLGG
jgi:hypothetical protein